ncbi:MAG: diguanylate cyclase [Thermoleophilaceae bacterium]|nr:diguanylate cyclase [Thermoleophilaceae bacterium]
MLEAWERFHGAFVSAPVGMALVGLDGGFLSANHALCALLGRSEKELTALTFQTLTHSDDLSAELALVERVLKGELDRYELEKRYLKPDGSIVWGLLCVSLVRGPEREPVHFVAQIQDISVRKEAEQELRRYSDHLNELALQDPLTGLRNYRDFHAALDREIERARRHGGSLSVVLVDVEGLAQINRTRGHVEGDHVLREVGRAVAGVCRACDLAARVGGDKLALVLPETGEQGAEEVTERARRAVAEVEEGLSLSHGIACWPAAGDSKELLLRRADVALHIAKPSRPPETPTGTASRARCACASSASWRSRATSCAWMSRSWDSSSTDARSFAPFTGTGPGSASRRERSCPSRRRCVTGC